MSKRFDADARVKKALTGLMQHDGDWQIMLDILHTRGLRDLLVERRKELGLTQAQLAERLDINQPSVAEFETAPFPDPLMSTVRRYCSALELESRWGIVSTTPLPEPADEKVQP